MPNITDEIVDRYFTYTVQKGDKSEKRQLTNTEIAVSVAAFVIFLPLLGAGIPIFLALTDYFKKSEIQEYKKTEGGQPHQAPPAVQKADVISQQQLGSKEESHPAQTQPPSPRDLQFQKPLPPIPQKSLPVSQPPPLLPKASEESPPKTAPSQVSSEQHPSVSPPTVSLQEPPPPQVSSERPPSISAKPASAPSYFPFGNQAELEAFVQDAPHIAHIKDLVAQLSKAGQEADRTQILDALLSNLYALKWNESNSPAGKKAQGIIDVIEGKQKEKAEHMEDIQRRLENPDLSNLRNVLRDIRVLDVITQDLPFGKVLETKFSIHETKGDGNCAAYAIHMAAESGYYPTLKNLLRPGPDDAGLEPHEIVRKRAVDYMRQNPAIFQPFCHDIKAGLGQPEQHIDDFDTYLAVMGVPGTYMGSPEFASIAMQTDLRLQVYNPSSVYVDRNGHLAENEEFTYGVLGTEGDLFLQHSAGNHYRLLLPKAGVELPLVGRP